MKTGSTSLAQARGRRSRAASALIIVLCFIVLLTVVVLAMLSHSIFNGMIAGASSNLSKTDIYGHGAIEQITGDLEQEIVAGSANVGTTYTNTLGVYTNSANVVSYIYRPAGVTNSVPYNSGPYAVSSSAWANMPNLVKESAHGVAFEPYDTSIPERAAAAPTTTPSRNGRYVTLARWNKALLLPKSSATITVAATTGTEISETSPTTDTTPNTNSGYYTVPPDWILTTADGSNPTTLDTTASLTTSNVMSKSPKFVVGRYAYNIYNEGGLLDANVAGCPAASTATGWTGTQKTLFNAILSRRGPAAFADLTQLPGLASINTSEGSTTRAQKIVDSLVGWRNSATAQASLFPSFPKYSFTSTSVNNYFSYLLGFSNNFMSAGNTSLNPSNNLSDRIFTSRQQMISFFQNIVAVNSTEQAYLQDAMMYLGTFSRSLNQPSYWPDPSRPRVVGPAASGNRVSIGSTGYALDTQGNPYNGGNSVKITSTNGQDDIFNPSFKSIRVLTSFTRNDGTTAAIGDPLVAKRFALNRLMWLTYKGPSANVPTSDALFKQYLNIYTGSTSGTTPAWLLQLWNEGTAANIKAYFGLTWTAGPGIGGIGGYWTYNHDIQSGGTTILGSLSDVANNTTTRVGNNDGAEPDFFELLKASVNCGSVGVAVTTIGGVSIAGTNTLYTPIQDSAVTPQIFQLGANIIDEANPTQYPTHIIYTFASGDLRSVYGAMDLPYFSALAPVAYIVKTATAVSNPTVTPDGSPGTGATAVTTSSQAGEGAILEVPSIWNPYDVNGPTPSSSLAPTNLRIAVSSDIVTLDSTLGGSGWPGTASNAIVQYLPTDSWSTGPVPPITNPAGSVYTQVPWSTESDAALIFANPAAGSTLYREPTALIQLPNSGKNSVDSTLSYDPGSLLAANSNYPGNVTEAGSNNPFIGFFVANFPLRWSTANPATTGASNAFLIYTTNSISFQQSSWTVRMEYSTNGSSGPWIPYMEFPVEPEEDVCVPVTEVGTNASPYLLSPNVNNHSNSTGSIWDNNLTGCLGTAGTSDQAITWDPRTARWGCPTDVAKLPFIDGSSTLPSTDETVTLQPGTQNYSNSHSTGTYMAYSGVFEPNGGVIFGLKQQNLFSSPSSLTTDYYMDPDGTVRRAAAAYLGGSPSGTANLTPGGNWAYTANSTVGLMLAGTTAAASSIGLTGASAPSPATNQSQNRPIILHRPYRTVAELGHVFSGTPYRNIDFFTPESGYSALLDTFCINEDYRPDAVMAGRVDLNTKQAPVLQALLAGAYRDEENNLSTVPAGAAPNLTPSEAVTLSQALVKRTTVGGTNPAVSLSSPQPLTNVGDLVGRWISGTTQGQGNGLASASPISGAASYDGFSADLAYATSGANYVPTSGNTPVGNFNILQRFRETTMRALSDAGQAGTWNLLIDVVAQSGRFPVNAAGPSDFLVEGERHYWVHIAIDRTTGQVIDQSIEVVNE